MKDEKRIKALIFLGIYLILFIVIITSNQKNNITKENKIDKDNIQNTKQLENANFEYKYTIILDDLTCIYNGKKYEHKDLYTLICNSEEKYYYTNNGITLVKENDKYVLTDKIYYLFDYLEIDNILKILKNVVKDNNMYTITNIKLGDITTIFNNSNQTNQVNIYYDSNKNISKIELNLLNYAKYVGKANDKAQIILEYFSYGKVNNFNIS